MRECQDLMKDANNLKISFDSLCEKIPQLQDYFATFCQQACEQSKLFKFWKMYTNMVQLLLRFIRAERNGLWELHLNAVAEMAPYFFSMDRINYSRWLPVYIAEMQMLPTLAPEVNKEFLEGNHSVSRSSQPFRQVWTDMALEQSINLDSKTGGGIIGFTQNPAALERWFITSHKRASITTAMKQLCNIEDSDKVGTHKEAGSLRVRRDETDVHKLLKTISIAMSNPFDLEEASKEDPIPLRNIATGVVMPSEESSKLINSNKTGAEKLNNFISKRLNTTEVSFWDKITKENIKTFSILSKTKKIKSSDEKIITINADRSLFGRLLIAAKNREIDLKEVLSYELSTVPFALAHTDGSLRKTTKSVLMGELELVCTAEARLPEDTENSAAYIFDAMAMIQMLRTASSRTFGELAEKHFKIITAPLHQGVCSRVDVFDRYDIEMSIKEGERSKRGCSNALEIKITSIHTPVPKQWLKYMAISRTKSISANFLFRAWCDMGRNTLQAGQQLIIGGGSEDPTKAVIVTSGQVEDSPDLQSDHEEADTKMILHASQASSTKERIVIHSPDTDVAVLATHAFNQMKCKELWFKTGVKDTARFLPIHSIAEKLGVGVCAALPGLHALTGCDSTSGLNRIGKKKAWKAFINDPSCQDDIGNLGTQIPPSRRTQTKCEQYICSLYTTNKKAGVNSDDIRHWMFCQKHQRSESLPPTSNSLHLHIKRANYQAFVWKRSAVRLQGLPSPVGNGWKEENGSLEPLLMSRDPAPQGLIELTICKCRKSLCKSDHLCQCKANGMACTEACLCMNGENCLNPCRAADEEESEEDD